MSTTVLTSALLVLAASATASPDDWPAMSFHSPEDLVAEIQTPGLLAEVEAMSCKPGVQVSLGQDGLATITAGMLVKAPAYPLDQYEVDIMGPLGDVVSCDEIGQELMAVVEEPETGNTCMSVITVEDKLPPFLSCSDDTIPCNVIIPELDFLSFVDVVEDNCDEMVELTYSYVINEFDCDPDGMAGRIDLTVAAVDDYGNASVCMQSIYLEKYTLDDVVFPPDTMISCTDPDTSIENVGQPMIGGTPVTHFCELVVWRMQSVIPLCSGEFKVARVWNVMDWCTGETEVHMQSILVIDTIPPDIECPNDMTIGTDPSVCYATYEFPDVVVTDVCSDDELIQKYFTVSTVPGLFDVGETVELDTGEHVITIYAQDDCLGSSECSYTITVVDDEAPVLVCHDYSTNLGSDGMSVLLAASAQFFATDNCGIDSIAVRKMDDNCENPQDTVFGPFVKFCCAEAGDTVMVVFQAIDFSGNEQQCMIEVTVKDQMPPDAFCYDSLMVFLDEFGMAMITPDDIDSASMDNCDIVERTIDREMFTCQDLHDNPHIVTLSLTDPSGNMSECQTVVTVKDTVPPTPVCKDITIMLDDDGTASITPLDIDDGSFDNCIIFSRELDIDEFGCDDVGEHVAVVLTITDESGNSDTCQATVFVLDNPPEVECKDATLCLDENGVVEVLQDDIDEVMDDCGIAEVLIEPDSLFCDDLGENVVTLTVTDVFGNTASCTSTVTVEDCTPPECTAMDVTVELDEDGMASLDAEDVDGGSTDECGIESLEIEPMDFDCEDVGTPVVVILTVTDFGGNSSSCSATVTVEDNNMPECETMDITVYLDENGEKTIDPDAVDDGSSTTCGLESITVFPNMFDCEDAGDDVVVTQTVTDINGNMASCTATVTVLDTISPECEVADITLFLDEDGLADLEEDELDDGSSDNCEIESITLDPDEFDCEDVGTVTVTQTVTDVNGNSSTCEATVTIMDDLEPICEIMDITVMLDEDGMATIEDDAMDDGSSDNCDIESIMLSQTEFDCEDGESVVVTQTVTDVNGNTASCTGTVFIENNEEPMASCQDVTVYLDEMGMASITPEDVDAGSAVNCGDLELMLDITEFDCEDTEAPVVVTLTVTDQSDQMSTCTANVTVLDTISPECSAQDVTVHLDDMGNASTSLEDVNDGSSDNCDVELSLDPFEFDCNDTGDNTVTLTATDPSGNMSTCEATVTVLDTTPPECAIVDPFVIVLDGSGTATLDADDFDDGSSDNCNVITLSIMPTMFTCEDLGDNVVTLTVTDDSGNTSTCTTTVTVEDGENFIALCQDITVSVGDDGTVTIDPGDIDDGSGGGCNTGDLEFELSQTEFRCEDLGENEVTLIVTDGMEIDSCTATVTVVDLTDPVINCPADVTVPCGTDVSNPDDFGMASATDNCEVAMLEEEVVEDIDECGSGTLTRTFTATDQSGNTASCVQIVTLGASGSFDENNITWPPDANLPECSSTDPEDIMNGEPVIDIPEGSCALISVSFSDSTITTCDTLPETPCIQIFRTWTVIDTCQLEDGTNNGIFTHVQMVVVDDNTGPIFSPQADITVEVDPQTCTADVVLMVTATSCGDMVDVTNDFNDGGGNASGEYPIGLTTVTFTAEDECCNISTLEVDVLVEDSGTPVVTCIKPIYCMPDELILTLNADEFITFSNPNGCLTEDDFYFSFSENDPFDSINSWTCSSAGDVPLVPIWVFNQQLELDTMCNADLDLNDGPDGDGPDGQPCPDNCPNNFNIIGEVYVEDGTLLSDIPVIISDPSKPMTYTNDEGRYVFANLQPGDEYHVRPEKLDGPLEGVTTLDLVAIQKHLLGLATLDSPYKQIAADIVANGEITALDLLELRKMLLGYQLDFSQNTSWRFVDSHFEFPDPNDPFMIPFDEEMMVPELMDDMLDADFIAVKTGDVNNTVANLSSPGSDDVDDRTVAFTYPDLDVEAGEVIRIPVSAVGFDEIVGYQFTLEFDIDKFSFRSVNIPAGSHLQHENFGYVATDDGMISVSWNQGYGTDVDEEAVLFELEFLSLGKGRTAGQLSLSDIALHSEAYVDSDVIEVVDLDIFSVDAASPAQVEEFALMQNRPNPFNESTEIPFYLPSEGMVEVMIHAMDGQMVYTTKQHFPQGIHTIRVYNKALPVAGVYYYTVITDKFRATRKMTLLD